MKTMTPQLGQCVTATGRQGFVLGVEATGRNAVLNH
jgi:hypothetical protein